MVNDRNTGITRSQLRDYELKRQDLSPAGLVWQEPVIDKDLTTPPGEPSIDDRYLVISGGSGTDWAGHDNDIAHYHSGQWNYYTPIEGWFVWVNDENKLYRFDGSSWAEFEVGIQEHSLVDETFHTDKVDFIDAPLSPTILTGAIISEGTNAGTFKVSALTALLRKTASDTGELVKITLAEQDNQTITSADVFYHLVLEYNSGSPQISISTSRGNGQTNLGIGHITKESDNTVHYSNSGNRLVSGIHRLHKRASELRRTEISDGFQITDKGSKKFSIAEGISYRGINRFVFSAFDTSISAPDTFTYVYYNFNTSSWVYVPNQTDIDVNNYNLVTSGTGLTAIAKLKCDWVFIHPDDGHVYVVYGQDDDKKADILLTEVPDVPDLVDKFGVLIGRIIIETGVTVFDEIQMIENVTFNPKTVSDHNDLSGLNTGDYRHLTDAQKIDLTDGGDCAIHKHDDKYYTESEVNDKTAIDDFTIKRVSNELKIADRIELNTMLNAFRIAINGSLSQFSMVDGIVDEYEDESGIDTVNSLNEDYDSSNDLYKPTEIAGLELDYMEYASDGAAQAAYVTDAEAGLPSSEYSSDSYTKLLLHLNGADESTTITDDGNTGHTVNAGGDAELDTAQKKFGTASVLFNGNGYLYITDHADFDLGSGDFTVDFWWRLSANESYAKFFASQGIAGNEAYRAYFNTNAIKFEYSTTGNFIPKATWAFTPSINTWYHVAFVRNGTDLDCYINGTALSSTYDISTDTIYNSSGNFNINAWNGNTGGQVHWLDEFRFSKGIVRWTSDFDVAFLQCYSEASIKNQGTYSLKAVAAITDSLDDTLIKSGLSLDLTDKLELKLWVYASRTGTNLQIQIHDSGGQTSTKDIVISSIDTWTEITWDISGISNADKDNIDSIIIKIINADSANTFYIDNFRVDGVTNNMTLISNSFTAEAAPDDARLVLFEGDVDSITENTDIKAYVSRDGGSTYAQVTLSDEGNYESGKRILTGVVDLTQSGIGSGTNMEYKIETLNNKSLKLHGVGLHWD